MARVKKREELEDQWNKLPPEQRDMMLEKLKKIEEKALRKEKEE